MSEAGSGQERTEDATPKRRLEARRKGTIAKSQDLNSALMICAMIAVLPPILAGMGDAFRLSFIQSLQAIPEDVTPATMVQHGWAQMTGPIAAFLPLLAVIMGVGLVANFAQVGFSLSTEALKPTFNKINPFQGFKRMFSQHAVMEGVKATVKSLLFGYLAWSCIESRWDELVSLAGAPGYAMLASVGSLLHAILVRVGIAWLVLAAADYLFQRKQVDKQLRMTKEEVKQEMKEQEQSPELKMAMMRARRRNSKRMMQAVKSADAIITNPTHFSIAIKYEPGKSYAPQVVAKGQDLIALRIREIAKEHGVPIVPNPPLARQLYKKCEVGDFIPRELFQAVAEVLAYVYRTVKSIR